MQSSAGVEIFSEAEGTDLAAAEHPEITFAPERGRPAGAIR